MKAPDKIYLHKIRDEESSGFHKMWFEQRARCVPSEEYIRKGALIDALNKILEARPPEAKGPASTIAAMVFQQLIERIKSI